MLRNAFRKSHRTQKIDFQVGKVLVSFYNLCFCCFWRCWIDSTLPAFKVQGRNRRGSSPWSPTPRATSIQDLVSRMLVAISPVTALRATRMWREETNYGVLPDLWIAAAVRTPAAVGMYSSVEEDHQAVRGPWDLAAPGEGRLATQAGSELRVIVKPSPLPMLGDYHVPTALPVSFQRWVS